MKTSAQILLLLALVSLSFSFEVTVTKSFHNHVSVHFPSTSTGSASGSSSGNEEASASEEAAVEETVVEETAVVEETTAEETETPVNPGAAAFNACDPNNRPQICTLEYAPVCGYINQCQGGNCTATFGNGCSACGNSTVDGYVNGACEDAQTACDPNNRPEICTLIYTATCAVASNCQGSFCFENTSSSCVACGMEGVGYSLPGICPGPDWSSELQNCDPNNRPQICTLDYTPVCARLSNCVGESCWSNAGNACSACADDNIDSYLPGECPENGNNNEEGIISEEGDIGVTECDANNRPTVCTADFTPVCAHISGCDGDEADCTRTESNGCTACGRLDVDYFVDGECPS